MGINETLVFLSKSLKVPIEVYEGIAFCCLKWEGKLRNFRQPFAVDELDLRGKGVQEFAICLLEWGQLLSFLDLEELGFRTTLGWMPYSGYDFLGLESLLSFSDMERPRTMRPRSEVDSAQSAKPLFH